MKVDPKFSTCFQGSVNTCQPNAWQIPHPTEFMEDNRETVMWLSCEIQFSYLGKEPERRGNSESCCKLVLGHCMKRRQRLLIAIATETRVSQHKEKSHYLGFLEVKVPSLDIFGWVKTGSTIFSWLLCVYWLRHAYFWCNQLKYMALSHGTTVPRVMAIGLISRGFFFELERPLLISPNAP